MRYAIVIEKASRNYSAFAPDLPGCIATGKTVAQTLENMSQAIEMHVAGLVEDGLAIPDPSSVVDYVDIRLPQKRSAVRSDRRKAS